MIPVTVTFYGDVGFDRSYNHVIDFSNETERENYFSPKTLKSIQDCAYNKPMNSLQIKCPYEEALNFTYCKFIIGSSPNSRKIIYAWIDDVVLITDQKDETNNFVPILQINISIDPWQTFLFNFRLGESFVAREHVDRFKDNTDGTRGWCLPNTSDRSSNGIEIRSDSLITFRETKTYIRGTYPYWNSFKSRVYWICVQCVISNNMRVYLIPVLSQPIRVNVGGGTVSTIQLNSIVRDTFLNGYDIDPETVASCFYIPFDVGVFNAHDPVSFQDDTYDFVSYLSEFSATSRNSNFCLELVIANDVDNFPYVIDIDKQFTTNVPLSVPTASDAYSINHEPQLFKSPYKTISIVDENGIKRGDLPDICANINNGFSGVKLQLLIDSVDVRLRIKPLVDIKMDNTFWIEYTLTQVEVIRNNWLSYLLQERETTREMIQSQINQQAIATAIGGVSSAVGQGGQQAMSVGKSQVGQSELGGFASGAVVGLGVGAIQTVGGYVANKHFAFEQQDIREKAIKRKANNIIQSGTFKSLVGELEIVITSCDTTTLDIKAKEFHKYGYSVFFYETPNLKSRKYFNFIATNLVKIEGSLNNNIKMSLAEIFNNGVTIWHGDYINELTGIGDYSKENIERSLL